ncbi:MAG: hypothetical protein FWH55_04895 [Oscillospiraceae bacterium]|nr:hypothetical protein [Oscillospiraceae bacterium]
MDKQLDFYQVDAQYIAYLLKHDSRVPKIVVTSRFLKPPVLNMTRLFSIMKAEKKMKKPKSPNSKKHYL